MLCAALGKAMHRVTSVRLRPAGAVECPGRKAKAARTTLCVFPRRAAGVPWKGAQNVRGREGQNIGSSTRGFAQKGDSAQKLLKVHKNARRVTTRQYGVATQFEIPAAECWLTWLAGYA